MLSFVWCNADLSTVAMESANRTRTRIIVEIAESDQIESVPDSVDILVSLHQIKERHLVETLLARKFETIWVSCLPQQTNQSVAEISVHLRGLSSGDRFGWIVGSLDAMNSIREGFPGQKKFAVKGNEAAGFVGRETSFTLFAAARDSVCRQDPELEIHIWGGVGTPDAAAAFLTAGARGVVFESLHWLTDQVTLSSAMRVKIGGIQVDHTRVVGTRAGFSYRLFDKGNSTAARELDAICESAQFAGHIADACEPLRSEFGKDQLIPLGVEAAFTASFARRFGNRTDDALRNFRVAVESAMHQAPQVAQKFMDSRTAARWGTRFPIIQGAMSWITDEPEFAKQVAAAGGIPTIALGTMSSADMQARLGRICEALGGRPYAVNIIALPENPEREAQLDWIRKNRPRFVVIAAGEPSFGKQLLEDGIDAVYIAPTEDLVKLALEMGYRQIICEGCESGGHIGPHSTLTLAQSVLDLRDRRPDLFEERTIILAGGICNRETAFIAAMLGADAIQMGTAYLMTEEIVETGAMSALYREMIRQAGIGDTVVTGESVGLRVRSLRNEKTRTILELERDYDTGNETEAEFRQRLEALAVGSLRTAAHGENPDSDRRQGQFMSGTCAGILHDMQSLAELHQEVTAGPLTLQSVHEEKHNEKSASLINRRERIAITGMSLVNALGNTPQDIWQACVELRSGVTAVSPSRWDHARYFDPRPMQPEKTYCGVGAFRNLPITRQDIDVPPQDFRSMTDATKTALWVAKQAVEDSGILASSIDRQRISVILSQNSSELTQRTSDMIVRQNIPDMIDAVRQVVELTSAQEQAVAAAMAGSRSAHDDTSLTGRLSSVVPGFVCNKYGFTGPSYSVLAACASALAALHSAVQLMENGLIDAAVVGGAEESLSPLHFAEFSILGALGGLTGVQRLPQEYSRPFDIGRDGLILGEGAGMLVIERETVAKQRGARIYGYITGVGASNSETGMVESSRHSQLRAIRASLAGLDYGPADVDLVECHATSTRQGDMEEVWALKTIFPTDKQTVLSSFKSQIGHTLGAAGINSLIRGIMAMNAEMYPPSLNCTQVDPAMEMEGSGLLILPTPQPWPAHSDRPRRFQVNAFGFGGSNYVVQVEASGMAPLSLEKDRPEQQPENIYNSYNGTQFFTENIGGEPFRLAVIAADKGEARVLLEQEEVLTQSGAFTNKRCRALQRQGIFIAPAIAARSLAFVFPGQGSQYVGMGQELYDEIPFVRRTIDAASEHFGFDVPRLLFASRAEELQNTRWQQPAIFVLEYALAKYFLSLGVRPTALAGHSLGQFTALCLAGAFSFADGCCIVNQRGLLMEKAGRLTQDPGVMLAVNADRQTVELFLGHSGTVHVLNINSPLQTVIGGDTADTLAVGEQLSAKNIRFTRLPVSMAFHSPLFGTVRDEFAAVLATIPFQAPQLPVLSNHTHGIFPSDPTQMRQILADHMVSPVDWLANVQTLSADYGVTVFLEVGPREALGNLIADILPTAVRISVCMPSVEKPTLQAALAQLAVLGALPFPQEESQSAVLHKSVYAIAAGAASNRPMFSQPISNDPTSLDAASVIQREINAFVIQCFGEMLKPKILAAMRREVDPTFTAAQLEQALTTGDRGASPATDGTSSSQPRQMVKDLPGALPKFEEIQKSKAPASLTSAAPGVDELLTGVIDVIVQTTGYEREEIGPDMDLREDLAIRSSRLPVIADALEHRFQVKLDLQTFAEARTVRDIADRMASLNSEGNVKPTVSATQKKVAHSSPTIVTEIRRLTFKDLPLSFSQPRLLQLAPMDTIALLHPVGSDAWGLEAVDVLRRDHGTTLGEITSAAGLIITVDFLPSGSLTATQIGARLRDVFLSLQRFLASPAKKFVLLLHRQTEKPDSTHVLAEGILGMLLSAAWEYRSVFFRFVRVAGHVDSGDVVRRAFDRTIDPISISCRDGVWSVETAVSTPLAIDESITLPGPEDVFLVSGGGAGITSTWVRAMVPFGSRFVLLGRTFLESGDQSNAKSAEIKRTLQELTAAGIDACYRTCDVADQQQVAAVVAETMARYGRITGVIHGAGFLHDGFVPDIKEADITTLVSVKLEGADHLFDACKDKGLRWFFALSSIAAVKGNPGQVNYTAANRAMAGMLDIRQADRPDIICRALMLPPLEGGGMADTSEIRTLMSAVGYEYVHVNEMANLFCREFSGQRQEPSGVLFQRSAPETVTAPPTWMSTNQPSPFGREPDIRNLFFSASRRTFPMIDSLVEVDLKSSSLTTLCLYNPSQDLWLPDHKPSKEFKFPLVSGVMMVESFFETARLLYPYLQPCGVRDLQFIDMINCPPNLVRQALCRCVGVERRNGEVVCEADLRARQIAPGGRDLDRLDDTAKASVVLRTQPLQPSTMPEGFPLEIKADSSGAVVPVLMVKLYEEYTGYLERYRMLIAIDHGGSGFVVTRVRIPTLPDFASSAVFPSNDSTVKSNEKVTVELLHRPNQYLFEPYVLEALFQSIAFQATINRGFTDGKVVLIPHSVAEITLYRNCLPGENLSVQAIERRQDDVQIFWDAVAIDGSGVAVMKATEICMQWLSV